MALGPKRLFAVTGKTLHSGSGYNTPRPPLSHSQCHHHHYHTRNATTTTTTLAVPPPPLPHSQCHHHHHFHHTIICCSTVAIRNQVCETRVVGSSSFGAIPSDGSEGQGRDQGQDQAEDHTTHEEPEDCEEPTPKGAQEGWLGPHREPQGQEQRHFGHPEAHRSLSERCGR
eukprot:15454333-Alexandrium_andersonii.AAC.1